MTTWGILAKQIALANRNEDFFFFLLEAFEFLWLRITINEIFSPLVRLIAMKSGLKTGLRYESAKTILESHTITFEGLPPVLATPFLVWLLEETAMELLDPFLEEDDLTLGTQVDIEHLGMARIGDEVTFVATVVNATGRDYLFRVEAMRQGKSISKGLHRRKLVSKTKLQKQLAR
jgi:fluoroacetyl-CoA thioesterase